MSSVLVYHGVWVGFVLRLFSEAWGEPLGWHSFFGHSFRKLCPISCVTSRVHSRSLFHLAGGRTHGGGLLGFGVNADQRHSAHCAAAEGNHVTASPQIGLQFIGQGVGDRQAAQVGTVLAEGTDEMRGGECRALNAPRDSCRIPRS